MTPNKLHQQLTADLAKLRLPYSIENYKQMLAEAESKKWSMLQFLAHLMASEAACFEERALDRRIRYAHLPKDKTLADYDFHFPKRIAKQKLLNYFDCDFIRMAHNLVIIGNQGVGKTHLLTALGYRACRKGISTRFVRVIDMINNLTAAQQQGTLGKALKIYSKPALLLLDELGYLPVDKRGADLMFQVVAARYESGSMVITTNRPFKNWGEILDVDTTLASAMIDRLMHHGEAIVIEGKSYRVKDRIMDS